jgi:hypothetical protein
MNLKLKTGVFWNPKPCRLKVKENFSEQSGASILGAKVNEPKLALKGFKVQLFSRIRRYSLLLVSNLFGPSSLCV